MSKKKELIIFIISIVALVLAITTTVFATDGAQDLNSLLGDTNNTSNNNSFEQIPSTTNNTNTNTNTTNTNTNTNNNATNTIPYTGVDYSVIVIIAICGVSAVYAYKKIRDYNV